MALNNSVTLVGNITSEARIHEKNDKLFAAFSIATKDSYKDKASDEWKDKATEFHSVLVFKPETVQLMKSFKKGARLQVEGSISYRDFEIKVKGQAKPIKKKEATIIAHKVEPKPLARKAEPAPA